MKVYVRRTLVVVFLALLILALAQIAQAADGTLPLQTTLEGNYCVAYEGIGLLDGGPQEFSVTVQGTPVEAYIYWSGRYPGQNNGDGQISAQFNGGAINSISSEGATSAYAGFADSYYYTYHSANIASLLPAAAVLNVSVDALTTPEAHGAGIVVISEDPTCPFSQVQIKYGLDGFFWNFAPDAGADTQVTCVDFTAAPTPRTMKLQMFVGGVEHDQMRGDRIWYATGTGATPADIVSIGDINNLLDGPVPPTKTPPFPLSGGIGEWDNYTNSITVPAGATYACFQIESIDGYEPTNGTSGVWLELSTQLIYEPGIDVLKLTNGNDAKLPNDADVPLITPGATVLWTYLVTNTGSVTFDAVDVTVTDSVEGAVTDRTADTVGDNDNSFEPGEVWTYQKSGTARTLSSESGSFIVNGCGNATTGGVSRNTYANSVTALAGQLSATDTSHYCNPLATATVGNYVWGDINPDGTTPGDIAQGDGIQDNDPREQGIDGIIVELHAADGTLIDTTVTSDGGQYLFTDLEPGEYFLIFINPLGEGVWTLANAGNDDTVDSDAVTNVVDERGPAQQTEPFTLDAGEIDLSWDAGIIGLSGAGSAAVGNFVWNDRNQNGLQDGGDETGVAGVTVRLFTSENVLVAETTTNDQGIYNFQAIDPGNYYVEFALPASFTVSPLDTGSNDEVDSDVDPTTQRTAVFNVPVFTTDLRWDLGLFQPTGLGEENEPLNLRIFVPLISR